MSYPGNSRAMGNGDVMATVAPQLVKLDSFDCGRCITRQEFAF